MHDVNGILQYKPPVKVSKFYRYEASSPSFSMARRNRRCLLKSVKKSDSWRTPLARATSARARFSTDFQWAILGNVKMTGLHRSHACRSTADLRGAIAFSLGVEVFTSLVSDPAALGKGDGREKPLIARRTSR